MDRLRPLEVLLPMRMPCLNLPRLSCGEDWHNKHTTYSARNWNNDYVIIRR